MPQQIGAKIGVDGEAEFKRSLGNIAAEAKALKAEMTALKTATGDEADEQERARLIAEKLNEQIENQRQRVELLTQKLDESKAATGETSTATSNYRTQLANAQTVLNQLLAEQEGMTDETKEFAKAEDDAGQAAITTGQLISAHLISDAIVGGLKTLARMARGVANAFAGIVTDSADYADEILTMSSVTGIATDELQAYHYMAELVDVDFDTLTGSQTKLLQTMSSAKSGTAAAVEAFEALGVSVLDGDGNLREVDAVFLDVIDALGRIDNAAERDAASMAVFGRSARDLNPLIEAGSDAIAAYTEEARAMGYIMSGEQLGAQGDLADAFARFENLRTSIRNQLGAGMAPEIERVLDKLIEVGQTIDWEGMGQSLGRLISSLADLLVRLLENGTIDRLIDWLNDQMVRDQLLHGNFEGGSTEAAEAAAAADLAAKVEEYQAILARINDPNAYMRTSEFTGEEFLDTMAQEMDLARMQELARDPALQAALHSDAVALGEDIAAGVAEGISNGLPEVRGGLFGIFSRPSLTYDAGVALGPTGGSAGVNYGGVSVQIYGAEGQCASDLYDEFSYRMQQDVMAREAVYR